MSLLNEFARAEAGSTVQTVALTAGAIGICCVAAAVMLDKVVTIAQPTPQSVLQASRILVGPRETTTQVTVDYTPIGSVPSNLARPIVLDPCTGERK